MTTRTWAGFGIAVRIAVGIVLLTAGVMKALGPSSEFAAAVDAYKLVPATWATPVALIFPWLEMWSGMALLLGYRLRWAALGAGLLYVAFITALTSALARGIDIASCGCFGPLFSMKPSQTLRLDIPLAILSLFMAWKAPQLKAWTLDQWVESNNH